MARCARKLRGTLVLAHGEETERAGLGKYREVGWQRTGGQRGGEGCVEFGEVGKPVCVYMYIYIYVCIYAWSE